MDKLKAAVLCAWGFATAGIYTVAAFVLIVLLIPFNRCSRAAYSVGKLWSRLILKTNRIRLDSVGLERIDPDRSYVFMANHASHLDPPAIAVSIPNILRFIGKRSLARIPVFGPAARMAGVIFIDRGDSERSVAALNRTIKVLKNGTSTLFFAEGTRSPDGRLLPFKKGGVMLALQAGLPIVPVTVTGSHSLFPKKQWFIRPGTLRIEVGEPIEVTRFTTADRNWLLQRVRTVIQASLDRGNRTHGINELNLPRPHATSSPHFS